MDVNKQTQKIIEKITDTKTFRQDMAILREFLRYPSGAIVAGGYLRDTYNGIKPKDIDVWMHRSQFNKEIDPSFLKSLARKRVPEEYQRTGLPIVGIKTYNVKNREINIVLLEYPWNPTTIIDSFDIGICQLGYLLSTGNFVVSRAFIEDVENKTLTCVLNRRGHQRISPEHFLRVQIKYPEHRIVIPASAQSREILESEVSRGFPGYPPPLIHGAEISEEQAVDGRNMRTWTNEMQEPRRTQTLFDRVRGRWTVVNTTV